MDAMSDDSDTHNIPDYAPDHDPNFIEQDVPPCLDPSDKLLMTDKEMMQLLKMEYGNLNDEEWIDMCKY
jgi:hypothetical protein